MDFTTRVEWSSNCPLQNKESPKQRGGGTGEFGCAGGKNPCDLRDIQRGLGAY